MTKLIDRLREATIDACKVLMDEWELTPEEIASVARLIPQRCKAIKESRDEDAWQEQQERLMSDGGPHDGTHRDNIIQAGRGHLLR